MAHLGIGVELLIFLSALLVAVGCVYSWRRVLALQKWSISSMEQPRQWVIAIFLIVLFVIFAFSLHNLVSSKVVFSFILLVTVLASLMWLNLLPVRKRRRIIDFFVCSILLLAAASAVIITFAIGFSLIFESFRFFQQVSLIDFFFSIRWSPSAIGPDGVGYFGVAPLLLGTFLITFIAMLMAIPIGLLSAIYLSHYAHQHTRSTIKPLLELLAGIPTVVYGFLALIVISPGLQSVGGLMGLHVAAESALGVGLVIGIMIIPYIASLSDDVLTAVPRTLLDGSLALGATRSETIKRVIVPAALPGIMASFLLAMSRAIGETMIVVMAAGYSARLTVNPLEAVTTVTVQIVSLLTGDQEFSSPKTLAAFALGFMLLLITLGFNLVAIHIIRHYREKYE